MLASKDGWLSYPVWSSNLSWMYISLSNSFKLLQVLNLYSPKWVIFMFLSHTVNSSSISALGYLLRFSWELWVWSCYALCFLTRVRKVTQITCSWGRIWAHGFSLPLCDPALTSTVSREALEKLGHWWTCLRDSKDPGETLAKPPSVVMGTHLFEIGNRGPSKRWGFWMARKPSKPGLLVTR